LSAHTQHLIAVNDSLVSQPLPAPATRN